MTSFDNVEGAEEEIRRERLKPILSLELSTLPKAELVLVTLGLKPATDIRLSAWNTPREAFEKSLSGAGLAFVKTKEGPDGNWAEYAVANTRETAERLEALLATGDRKDPAYREAFGKLMGYPETAIRAFVAKEVLPFEEIPNDPDNVMNYFRYSQEHWTEERELQRQWSRAIEKYAPEVYADLKKRDEEVAEEIRKERIGAILPLEIGAISKAELVLIILGQKPATEMYLSAWNSPRETFEAALRGAGLAFVETESGPDGKWRQYAVAQTRETAQQLGALLGGKENMDPAYHAAFGRLMGFPETAIESFLTKDHVPSEEVPPEPSIVMGRFKMSREHWREERELQRQWSRAIERYAPEVYLELSKVTRGRQDETPAT